MSLQLTLQIRAQDVNTTAPHTPAPTPHSNTNYAQDNPDFQTDTPEPKMTIESTSMDADLDGNLVVFSGRVTARDADYKLTSEKLIVHLGEEERSPEKIIASGNVRIEQKNLISESEKATIFPGDDRVLLEGNARVRQGANVFSGKTIEYTRSTGRVLIREGVRVSIADIRSLNMPAAGAQSPPIPPSPVPSSASPSP